MSLNTMLRCTAVLAVAIAPALQAQTGARNVSARDVAALDAYVAQAAKDWRVPGLGISVVKDGAVVLAKGYGVLEAGKPGAVDAHTRFAIGSTTKAMTTAALAMLVDEGRIAWDGRVIDYLPQLRMHDPYVTSELTIRDLLTHRSGLPGTDLFWGRWDYTQPEMIRRLRYIKPTASFRSRWQYQNVVYAIGGAIIEEVSGMSWADFLRTRLFEPLGMNETEPLVSSIEGKPNVATPHRLMSDTFRTVPKRSTDRVAAAGSVWSSVADMAKWMQFVLDSGRVGDRQLIKTATFREMVTAEIRADVATYPALVLAKPHSFSYGLGWFVHDYQGDVVWMHTGSIDGMSAIVGLLPARRAGVFVLANLDHAELRHALMYRVFDLFAGNPPRDWSRDLKAHFTALQARNAATAASAADTARHSLPLERYAGVYADSAYGTITVTHANGSLQARIDEEPARTLEPWRHEIFRTSAAPSERQRTVLVFLPDGTGNVAAVRLAGVTFTRTRNAN